MRVALIRKKSIAIYEDAEITSESRDGIPGIFVEGQLTTFIGGGQGSEALETAAHRTMDWIPGTDIMSALVTFD